MLVRYFVALQGCPSTCTVPLPVYSSVMSTSYSSLLRSMPVYQAQLNRTAFRAFAPAAGVYDGAPRPRPRPAPCPPPPGAAPRPPWAPWAGAASGAPPPACAKAEDGTIVRAAAIATVVHIITFREA